MLSILEWGVCALAITVFWFKYGKSKELNKKGRELYKKFESLMFPALGDISVRIENKSYANTFLSLPVTRAQFSRRVRFQDDENSNEIKGKRINPENLNFYKTLKEPYRHSDRLPLSSVPCPVCTDTTKPVVRDDAKNLDNIKNCLECEGQKPHNPWYRRQFAFFLFFWKKWFIGPQYHMVPLKDMMGDERLNNAIEEVAKQELLENPNCGQSLNSLIRKHKLRAEKTVTRMRAKQSKHPYFALYVRIASWIIGKTLGKIYPKILVRESQMDEIRKARASGHPILYLPVHRSHIDYVLVSWVLVASDLRAPLVAAGDNLNIPVFSLMMKSVGGFFIKRRLDRKEGQKDVVYRTILHSYMTRCLQDDNDMEFFIEGGRTRTGKPCLPKGGLLSIVVDTLLTQKVEDILVVPVNFSYERLLDGNYIREQLGQPKTNESFASAFIALWNSLQTKFGNARVDFGHPFSMKEYIQSYQIMKIPTPLSRAPSNDSGCVDVDNPDEPNPRYALGKRMESRSSITSIYGTDIVIEDQRDLINNLATHVIYDGIKKYTLMSTNAIAFILLNKYRDGIEVEKLEKEMAALRAELFQRHHDVGYSGDMREVINHGLGIMGANLVQKELVKTDCEEKPTKLMIKPVTSLPGVIDLSYYATCVTPIYALESVVATSLLFLSDKYGKERKFGENEVISNCLELCGILHHEFIFTPPCLSLEKAIRETLQFMKSQNIINYKTVEFDELDEDLDDLNEASDLCDVVSILEGKESYERLRFLKGLIKPILDNYSTSSHVLPRLINCEAQEKQLQMDMLAEVKSQLQINKITYGESLALDPIRNFIKLLHGWQVLETTKKENYTYYHLHDAFDNTEALQEVIKRISLFQF